MTKLIDIRMFSFLHFRARMWAMFDDETNRHSNVLFSSFKNAHVGNV